jgi:hypothetical protein
MSVHKLAVFVEGYTEVVFVVKLIEELAGAGVVQVEHREIRGGGADSGVRRTSALIRLHGPRSGHRHFILVYDCGGDSLVKSRVVQEHAGLTKAGYARVIGLRDLYPLPRADLARLVNGLHYGMKSSLCPYEFIVAVMESEAWFLAEASHFVRIDPAITVEAIVARLGFNPAVDDMEQRARPAQDMRDCYGIGLRVYQKGNAPQTVAALDFAQICFVLADRHASLKRLVENLASFLSS